MLLRPFLPLVATLLAFAQPVPALAADPIDQLASRQWINVESANFRVVTERPEKVARQMIVDLENLRYVSNKVRGATSLDGPPLTIVAMEPDSAGALGIPRNFDGVFHLSRKGYAAIAKVSDALFASTQIASAREVFLHEYHHFLLAYSPESTAYPLWYNEGMSEYWSSMQIEDGKIWFGDHSRNFGRERSLHNRFGKIAFETRFLFGSTRLKEGGLPEVRFENANFYSRARFAIHYFNSTPELRQQLAHYLRLHNMGLSQDQAVQLAFKKTYDELDVALRDYVTKNMVRRGIELGSGPLDLPQVAMKATRLDRAAVLAALADVIPRFIRADSPVSAELTAANLAANPGDPNAHALDLERMALPLDEAKVKFASLERRFPNDPRLLALHADIVGKAALQAGAAGARDWEARVEEARGLYRRSIAASAFNPRAYFGLGVLYAAVPTLQPVEEGIAALDTAVIYEGQPVLFRALADLYLRNKQLRQALTSIRSAVAFNVREERPFDLLLLENLELLMDLTSAAPTADGLRFKSGAVYTGPVRNGKPEGAGAWRRPNGSSYQGDFRDGLPSGRGTLTSERGVVYEGDFSQGYAQGKGHIGVSLPGKLVSYDGEVANAAPHGEGVMVTKGGQVAATFRNGVAIDGTAYQPASLAPRRIGQETPAKDITAPGNPAKGTDCRDAEAMNTPWCRHANNKQLPGPRRTDGK